MEKVQNNAKFAFFYLLSLFSLIFTAQSSGMIVFQIINKSIKDVIGNNSGVYQPDALKFSISALIIAAPIFYIVMKQIYKNLYSGDLEKDSPIRKWLSYLILFISSVVMIVWLIFTINNFFNGELSLKFALKALTALAIAATVFTFYFYDIRRPETKEKKDRVISAYFYATLVFVVAAFVASLFFVESPAQTRDRKLDEAVLDDFNNIDSAIQNYRINKGQAPANLDVLKEEYPYITDDVLQHPQSKERYAYQLIGTDKFELCADFKTSNINNDYYQNEYYKQMWPHEAGRQCLKKSIDKALDPGSIPIK